jgi:sugar-specific transcriptional regulator TrmB
MSASKIYYDLLGDFVATTWQKWDEELDKLEAYIQEQKAEDKNVKHLEIRLNNNTKRMHAIKELIQAAGNAISEVPKHTSQHDRYINDGPHTGNGRRLIRDYPDSYATEDTVQKIYELLINNQKL